METSDEDHFRFIDPEDDGVGEFLEVPLAVGGIENRMGFREIENPSQRIPDLPNHPAAQPLGLGLVVIEGVGDFPLGGVQNSQLHCAEVLDSIRSRKPSPSLDPISPFL